MEISGVGLAQDLKDQPGALDGPKACEATAYLGDPGNVGHKEVEKADQTSGAQVGQDGRERQIWDQREQDMLPP